MNLKNIFVLSLTLCSASAFAAYTVGDYITFSDSCGGTRKVVVAQMPEPNQINARDTDTPGVNFIYEEDHLNRYAASANSLADCQNFNENGFFGRDLQTLTLAGRTLVTCHATLETETPDGMEVEDEIWLGNVPFGWVKYTYHDNAGPQCTRKMTSFLRQR